MRVSHQQRNAHETRKIATQEPRRADCHKVVTRFVPDSARRAGARGCPRLRNAMPRVDAAGTRRARRGNISRRSRARTWRGDFSAIGGDLRPMAVGRRTYARDPSAFARGGPGAASVLRRKDVFCRCGKQPPSTGEIRTPWRRGGGIGVARGLSHSQQQPQLQAHPFRGACCGCEL